MNVRDELSVPARPARHHPGRRLGGTDALDGASVGTPAARYRLRLTVRLTGWRREPRAGPAASAHRGRRRSPVQVEFTRAMVLRSPQLSRHGRRRGVDRGELHAFRAPGQVTAGRA